MFLKDISQTPEFGKSVRVYEVYPDTIDALYRHGNVSIPSDAPVYPNQPLILKAGPQKSALAIVNRAGDTLLPASENISYFDIRGRNKEQVLLLNLLQNPDIRVIIVTGSAGTGKTVCVGGYSLEKVLGREEGGFDKLILSKPLEVVSTTRYWGTTPGSEQEKFSPFLKSFSIMFENLIGSDGKKYIETAIQKKRIDFFPLELMRGATLRDSIVWYDEAQNMNYHECATLGTRIDDVGQSKLILTGDLNQRDKRIDRGNTGLQKLVTSPHFLNSPLTAHVNLIKIERGAVAQLFHDVFEKDEEH